MRAITVAMVLFGAVAARGDVVALQGVDDAKGAQAVLLSPEDYQGRLQETLALFRDSISKIRTSSTASSAWKMRTWVVGVGAAAQVGVGPIVTVKAAPRFRLVFGDSSDPALP